MTRIVAPSVCFGIALSFLPCAWTSIAHAQESAESDTLEEVVVTAEKRPESLEKTSISIEVKSGEQLREEGKQRIDEIMVGTAGVSAQDSQVGLSFVIRGVNAEDVGSALQNAIPVIIDGVTQSRSEEVRGGTLDLSRSEVMRGPQGTNVGSSSLAGAVSLVTNDPVFKYEGFGTLEVGSLDLFSTQGVLNVPLSDTTAIRFAASTDKQNGYISAGNGDSDLTNYRIKYRWQPVDTLNIVVAGGSNYIGGDGVQQDVLLSTGTWVPYTAQYPVNGCNIASPAVIRFSGCPVNYIAVPNGVDFRHRSDPWNDGFPDNGYTNGPYRHTRIGYGNATVDWTLPFGTLTFLPSYQHSLFTSEEQWRSGHALNNDQTQDDYQTELRLASLPSSKIQWQVGAYYGNNNRPGAFIPVSQPGVAFIGPPCPGPDTCYTYQFTKENRDVSDSVYLNFKYPVIDTVRIVGALRYTRDDIHYWTNNGPGPFGPAGNVNGPFTPYVFYPGPASASFSDVTYRGGLEWDVLPQSMAYVTYSTGYQPGTVGYTPTGTSAISAQKQTLEQFNVGFKSRLLDNKLQTNVEVFRSLFKNRMYDSPLETYLPGSPFANATNCGTGMGLPPGAVVAPSVSPDATCFTINGAVDPSMISEGIDLDVDFLPTQADRLSLQMELLDAHYNSRPSINNAGYGLSTILTQIQHATPGALAANQVALANAVDGMFGQVGHAVLQNAPKFDSVLSYSHAFPFAAGHLTPKLDWTYKTKYWSSGQAGGLNVVAALANTTNLAWQPSYSSFDLYTTWQSSDSHGFEITGYVKNLTDEVILLNYTGPTVTIAAPRTYGAILSAHF